MVPFSELRGRVDESMALLDQVLHDRTPAVARTLLEHFPLDGGQLIRPGLVIASADLPRPDGTHHESDGHTLAVQRAAAAIELVHTGSLLHDDVVDRATVRRHHPTINLLFGSREAVLLGDFLLARAFHLVSLLRSRTVTDTFVRLLGDMVAGEFLELEKMTDGLPTEDHALHVVHLKTASLFAAACVVGALVAKQPRQARMALRRFGEGVGRAYQIADDVLDATACTSVTGKDFGSDLREGRPTLPLVHALRIAPEALQEAWAEGLPINEEEIIPLLHEPIVRERVLSVAMAAAASAEDALTIFPDCPQRDRLVGFARYAWQRACRNDEMNREAGRTPHQSTLP